MASPIRVAVTGAAGQIGYSLLFRIASGEMLGPDQPVILQCLELPMALNALEGVAMELTDCGFPMLHGIETSSDPDTAFGDADVVMLVGSKPRGPGQLRSDLIRENGPIFVGQGKSIDANAAADAKIIVVGNPCNTNCLIAAAQSTRIPKENWTAMTRLDHNRAIGQLAHKAGVGAGDVNGVAIWGNHSPTMFPDFYNARIGRQKLTSVITDEAWLQDTFVPTVGQRGKAIIEARGASSAASAANAVVDTVRDLSNPTRGGFHSVCVVSKGEYGTPEGLITSMPITVDAVGNWRVVGGISLNDYAKEKIAVSNAELSEERQIAFEQLGLS